MKPMIRIYENDTYIDREMNAKELAQYQADQTAAAERVAEEQAKSDAKAALLARLGITAEEVTLLLG